MLTEIWIPLKQMILGRAKFKAAVKHIRIDYLFNKEISERFQKIFIITNFNIVICTKQTKGQRLVQ